MLTDPVDRIWAVADAEDDGGHHPMTGVNICSGKKKNSLQIGKKIQKPDVQKH